MSETVEIISLHLKNFRSYSDEFIDFRSLPDEILVEGINEDAGGAESVGAEVRRA